MGADADRGAFLAPTLLYCREPAAARAVHTVEAFGPVCTLVPYDSIDEAIELARRGGGSLAGSIFSADDALAASLVLGIAPFHGRIVVVNRHCAKESTGHGSPLPHLVHGGPGRAGGGEEMGGIRGVMHYMQRTAIQGTPDLITAVTSRWTRGARELDPGVHPFRKPFGLLRIGDTFHSAERAVTVEDIERFAALSGDHFYAHMDEAAAARNPLFGGRVAHGYFLVSAAAGLFVDPPYGPVLANYGIDGLRFTKPVKPGDRIKVRLTCKEKSLRAGAGYGEVRWDTAITNQAGEAVANYDVLTMVSEQADSRCRRRGRGRSATRLSEVLEHRAQRVGADVHRAGEGVIDRDDHEQAHEHDEGQDPGHGNLGLQVARPEEEREAHGEHATEHQHDPQVRGHDAVGEVQTRTARLRDRVELVEYRQQHRLRTRGTLREAQRRGVQVIQRARHFVVFLLERHLRPVPGDDEFQVVGERGAGGAGLWLRAGGEPIHGGAAPASCTTAASASLKRSHTMMMAKASMTA